jgi:crotonobetainyl-CoA:carnitine CoA-transferase CaiB-like acyl-CoA transferase
VGAPVSAERELAELVGGEPESALAEASTASWAERFAGSRFGLQPVRSVGDVFQEAWVRDRGLVVTREHVGIGDVDTIGPTARLDGTPMVLGRPAPRPGADARDILVELGLGDAVDRLVATGAVRLDG